MPEVIPIQATAAPSAPSIEPRATTTVSAPYDYEVSAAAPASGVANQSTDFRKLVVNDIDASAANHATFFGTLNVGDNIVCNGVTWNIVSITVGTGTHSFGVSPPMSAPPTGVGTSISFSASTPAGTESEFPLFQPIIPPPVIGQGGGVLVGPAIAAAAVPPSVAGIVPPTYASGSATVPTAASLFPDGTTTPPSPPIVVDGSNFAVAAPGQQPPWTWPPPAQTPTTAPITLDGFAAIIPPWTLMAETHLSAANHDNPGHKSNRRTQRRNSV